jgi:hypothetical protein
LAKKPYGKRLLGSPRDRLKYNIKINIIEKGYEDWVDRTDSGWQASVNMVLATKVP